MLTRREKLSPHAAAMEVDQDLAALLQRNLTFNTQVVAPAAEAAPAPEQSPVYSVSQHYHHSNHTLCPSAQQNEHPRSISEPPRMTCEMILCHNGIDPSSLSPSQTQLFRIADTPQQERLIELWRICPPNNSADNPALAWTTTSVEQEEKVARMRLQRQQEEQSRAHHHQQQQQQQQQQHQRGNIIMSLDGTPIQTDNGRWVTMTSVAGHEHSEPYMVAGYMDLMQELGYDPSVPAKDAYTHFGTSIGGPPYSPSTDPVYMASGDSAPRGFHRSLRGPAGMHMDMMDVVM